MKKMFVRNKRKNVIYFSFSFNLKNIMFFCPNLYVGNVTVITLHVLNNLLAQNGHQHCQNVLNIHKYCWYKDTVKHDMGNPSSKITVPYATLSPFT